MLECNSKYFVIQVFIRDSTAGLIYDLMNRNVCSHWMGCSVWICKDCKTFCPNYQFICLSCKMYLSKLQYHLMNRDICLHWMGCSAWSVFFMPIRQPPLGSSHMSPAFWPRLNSLQIGHNFFQITFKVKSFYSFSTSFPFAGSHWGRLIQLRYLWKD